jgi:hypothetical protein
MNISFKNNYFKLLLSFLLILIHSIKSFFKWDDATAGVNIQLPTALRELVFTLIATIVLAIVFWILLAIINIKSGFANRIFISSILLVSIFFYAGIPKYPYNPSSSSKYLTLCDCLANSEYSDDSRCKTKFRDTYGTSNPSTDQMTNDYYNCK